MTYDTFKEQILAGMKDRIPLASVSIQSVVKNNNVQLDGLTIMEGGTNLSPTIYLNYFYETYQNGVEFSSILDTILHTYQSNKPRGKIEAPLFSPITQTSGHILPTNSSTMKGTGICLLICPTSDISTLPLSFIVWYPLPLPEVPRS